MCEEDGNFFLGFDDEVDTVEEGISSQDLRVCLKVLGQFDLYKVVFLTGRRYRDLRTVLSPYATELVKGKFKGKKKEDGTEFSTAEEFKMQENQRKYRQGRIARERALDELRVNRTALRANRISKALTCECVCKYIHENDESLFMLLL